MVTETSKTTPQGYRVTAHVLNVRKGPGTSNPEIFRLRQGDVVDVLAESGEWKAVRTARGEGWVHGRYLLPVEDAAEGFTVREGRLYQSGRPVKFVPTPNMGDALLKPSLLVMHYTAGGSAQESINWLANKMAKASAHLVIGRDGSVVQMVPFDRVAWHAGISQWKGVRGLNYKSIGIEMDNAGKLTRKGNNWATYTGKLVPSADVIVLKHRNESTTAGWAKYPEEQIRAAEAVARALVRAYGLREIVGHDDIAPARKTDPGPAFPMDEFRRNVLEA